MLPAGNRIPVSVELDDKNLPNGRKMVTLQSLEDAQAKETALLALINNWLKTTQ